MAEQRSDLHQLALQALKGVHEQREEILRAFVAKYRCQPDDAVQAMQTTVEGDRQVTRYWIERSKRMPAPPADGEVAELVGEAKYLVRELCDQADDLSPSHELFGLMHQAASSLTRAAELLQRQALVPVSVSERLPGPEDCDAEGCIWLWDTERRWVRQCREAASSNTWVGSSWLPGYALPVPEPNTGVLPQAGER